ncbi:MAG: hypothetical protein ACFFDT_16240, partial [Candidatus Hodarchaeota archaeon]
MISQKKLRYIFLILFLGLLATNSVMILQTPVKGYDTEREELRFTLYTSEGAPGDPEAAET